MPTKQSFILLNQLQSMSKCTNTQKKRAVYKFLLRLTSNKSEHIKNYTPLYFGYLELVRLKIYCKHQIVSTITFADNNLLKIVRPITQK